MEAFHVISSIFKRRGGNLSSKLNSAVCSPCCQVLKKQKAKDWHSLEVRLRKHGALCVIHS